MVKNLILALLLFYCYTHAQAQELYRIEKNNKYGYIDNRGKEVIKCDYIFAYTDTIKSIGFAYKKGKIYCFNNKGKKLFYAYNYDNGPDYVQESMFRIVNKKGLIGFSDTLGNVIIKPHFRFAFPFEGGKAKVTLEGKKLQKGEYSYWDSDKWFFISNPLQK